MPACCKMVRVRVYESRSPCLLRANSWKCRIEKSGYSSRLSRQSSEIVSGVTRFSSRIAALVAQHVESAAREVGLPATHVTRRDTEDVGSLQPADASLEGLQGDFLPGHEFHLLGD